MSPLSSILPVLFLCCTALYADNSKETTYSKDIDKPGSCPVPPERCFKAPRLDGICTKDHECPGQQKCCVHVCEYACVEPEKLEKSGQCPHMGLPGSFILYKCPSVNTTACVNDVDCEGYQKCCSESCVNKCRDPVSEPTVAEKSGQCPHVGLPGTVIQYACKSVNTTACVNDVDCEGLQKCCREFCTSKCRDPVGEPTLVEKSGQCPHVGLPGTVIRYACKSVNTTACVNDADCKGHQKCCSEFCVNKCREPMDKPGSCPVPPERCSKAPRLDGICTKDHQCPGHQKCCVRLCEYACIAPEKFQKSGQCPHVGLAGTVMRYTCQSVNTTACVNDVDCEGHQKCCNELCVNKCRDPVGEPYLGHCKGQRYTLRALRKKVNLHIRKGFFTTDEISNSAVILECLEGLCKIPDCGAQDDEGGLLYNSHPSTLGGRDRDC